MSPRPRASRAVCLAAALAVTAAAACAQSSQASDGTARAGARQLFDQACAKCHGADGAGGLASVPNGPRPIDLRDSAWQRSRSDEDIAAALSGGRGAMPPFADVLTTEQIAGLVAHVRSLRQP